MPGLVVAKFGGSTLGPDGIHIPRVVGRIGELKAGAKVVAVFSAPLSMQGGRRVSLTDVVLEQGRLAEDGGEASLGAARAAYSKILGFVEGPHRDACAAEVERHLGMAQGALDEARAAGEFADEVRSRALAFAGEVLMSRVMGHVLAGAGMRAASVPFDEWPIITDHNIESANFLASESRERIGALEGLIEGNEVVTVGGFIGRTVDGVATTYERGGSDRTAADLGILLHRRYETSIDFEKDSMVVSADPKVVESGLREVGQLSYNEARLAGMFGMKILDPIAIKEILENGADMPIRVTDISSPGRATTIRRAPDAGGGRPVKIVTGRENCAILRIESGLAGKMLASLETDRRYGEFVVLSPFARDGIGFARILFLDGDYVRRNEKYLLGFDPLAAITYGRGVVTLIGDGMWRARQVASRTSASIGAAGLNILNMDAQEETSRIVMVVEDAGDNVRRAIAAVHGEMSGD